MNNTINNKLSMLEKTINDLNSSISSDFQQSMTLYEQCSELSNNIKIDLDNAEKIFKENQNNLSKMNTDKQYNSDGEEDDIFDDDMFVDSDTNIENNSNNNISSYLMKIENINEQIKTEQNIENILQYYLELVMLLKNAKQELNKDKHIIYV